MWVDFQGEQPLSIRLRVERKPTYYFGNVVFPNFLIVVGSLSAFVIVPSDVGDRLSVTVTLMLAAVAFRFVVSSMLPKVAYLTLMDYYLLIGFVMLVILIGENAINGINGIPLHIQYYVDYAFIATFSIIWILLHIVALLVVLDKNLFRIPWKTVDAIDKKEDEEEGFIEASINDIKANKETDVSKQLWENFKFRTPEERAKIIFESRARKTTQDPSGHFHATSKLSFNDEASQSKPRHFSVPQPEYNQNSNNLNNNDNNTNNNGAITTQVTSSFASNSYENTPNDIVVDNKDD